MIIYIKICLKGLSLVLICKVQKKCAVSRKQLENRFGVEGVKTTMVEINLLKPLLKKFSVPSSEQRI